METRPPAPTSGGKFIAAMRPPAPSMAIQAVIGVGWDLRLGVVRTVGTGQMEPLWPLPDGDIFCLVCVATPTPGLQPHPAHSSWVRCPLEVGPTCWALMLGGVSPKDQALSMSSHFTDGTLQPGEGKECALSYQVDIQCPALTEK